MIVKNDKMLGMYDDFVEAFRAIIEARGGELYRVELVMSMKEEEAGTVKDLLTAEIEPIEAPVGRVISVKKIVALDPETDPKEVINVIDSFDEIDFYINSKLMDEELSSRDNVKSYDTVSDDDFIELLRTLSLKGTVIFVTSNKKLYVKSLDIKGVKSIYRLSEEPIEEILERAIKTE